MDKGLELLQDVGVHYRVEPFYAQLPTPVVASPMSSLVSFDHSGLPFFHDEVGFSKLDIPPPPSAVPNSLPATKFLSFPIQLIPISLDKELTCL